MTAARTEKLHKMTFLGQTVRGDESRMKQYDVTSQRRLQEPVSLLSTIHCVVNDGDASAFTARLTIDVTPDMRGRIKISAYQRGVTPKEFLAPGGRSEMEKDDMRSETQERFYPMDRGNPFNPPEDYAELRDKAPLSRVRLWDGTHPYLATRFAGASARGQDLSVARDLQCAFSLSAPGTQQRCRPACSAPMAGTCRTGSARGR